VRSKVATKASRPEEPRLLSPSKGYRDEALGLIFAPFARGDGFRHGAIGSTGFGKTFSTRIVIAQALERGIVDVVLTHDVKGAQPEFEGVYLRTVEEAANAGDANHLVFRGDPYSGQQLEVEAVAELGMRLAQRERLRVLLNIGELGNATTEGGRGWRSPSALWFLTQGRALGCSFTWTVQQPKRAPDEIFDLSSTIAYHHLDERSANYLGGTLLLEEQMVRVMPELIEGEFVVRPQGREWNRRVYRF